MPVVPFLHAQRSRVVGDGRAENRNIARRGNGGLKRRGRVGENQIHAVGGKLAGDGDTGRRVARGVLLVELDVRHFLGQRVLKALRRGIQRLMLNELADTHGGRARTGRSRGHRQR